MSTRGYELRLGLIVLGLIVVSLAQAQWKFSGYTQARFNIWDNDLSSKHDSFDIRRARIKAQGPISEDSTFKIQLDLSKLDDSGDNHVDLKDLVVHRRFNDQWSAHLGYTSVPFGFEVAYSSSKRLPLERSQAARQLFPGERDTGLYVYWRSPEEEGPEFLVGYSNGLRDWYDVDKNGDEDTDSDSVVARWQWRLPRHSVAGISYRQASRTRTVGGVASDFDDCLWGLHGRYNWPRHWAFQGEYYDGEDLGVEVSGWYGQVEYACSRRPATVFYRYDVYDFGGQEDYERHTAGLGWDLNERERLTVQGENYDDGKGGCFTNYGLQYQSKY